ncbi:MAG: hypothetical protein ACM3OB_10855 [Acidobacteriota bacterium]
MKTLAAWLTPHSHRPLLAAAAGLVLLLAGGAPARAVRQGPFTLEVLVDGRPLPELSGRGRIYVEALAGRDYALRLRNPTGRRVAVALSVDGLNTIDARSSTAREGSKWILGPYETLTLEGWQTSSSAARRFFFTSESASYGAWLGKTENLGVISAVVFRERVPQPAPIGPLDLERQGGPAPRQKAAGDAPSAAAGAAAPSARTEDSRADEYAATGIGRRIDHPVERVEFEAEPTPAACLEVRYEYRPALVRLGLLPAPRPVPDPLERRERAHGFVEPGFAPDPYRDERPHLW